MTKKRKRPRRSSALEGDEAEPLSLPKQRKLSPERHKLRGEREWQRRQEEAEFYRLIGDGPVSFTRPGLPPPVVPKPAEPTRSPGVSRRASVRGKGRKSPA
jgi:hypothetical protein